METHTLIDENFLKETLLIFIYFLNNELIIGEKCSKLYNVVVDAS